MVESAYEGDQADPFARITQRLLRNLKRLAQGLPAKLAYAVDAMHQPVRRYVGFEHVDYCDGLA